MKRIVFLFTLTFGILISCTREDPRPNFLFILVDDLGWTDLGSYGSEFYETPNVDKLSENGVVFNDAYASCPVCSPTRASIMTGKYPARLNITDWIPGNDPHNRKLIGPVDKHQLPLEETTLAEALKNEGYATFFAGKWHLGDTGYFPVDQGFDINKGGHHMGQPPGGYYSPYNNPVLEDGPEGEYLTDRLTTETLGFIRQNKDQPFLACLAFYTVHTPIQASKKHIEYYKDKQALPEFKGGPGLVDEHEASTRTRQSDPAYASMVHSMDENVGRIIDYLDESGLLENTYIIFTSDNGGLSTVRKGYTAPTSVRPLRAGKGWCYEGGIRVPLIISGPGIDHSTSDEPVSSIDFYPTILDMAGIDSWQDRDIDGLSLNPVLKGQNLDRKAIFWHYPHYHGSTWTPGAAIRAGDWKLVEFYDYEKTELYNLAEDIGETRDLSEEYPGKLRELKDLLRKMQEETGALFPEKNPAYGK
ncbi:MAG: sulfatase [Bacteroidales bacterium]|nr:sulfatase [Bacteroidales bacterium]